MMLVFALDTVICIMTGFGYLDICLGLVNYVPLAAGSLCGSFSKSHCEAGHLLDKLGGDRADCCWLWGCQVKFFRFSKG